MGPGDLCFDFPFRVKSWEEVLGVGGAPPSMGLSLKPLCRDSQGSGRGGDPAPQVGHFSPRRRTEAMDLPGQGWQNTIRLLDAGLCMRVGRVCFDPC